MIETITNTISEVNGMVWIGGGLFIGAIAYCIWLWNERM